MTITIETDVLSAISKWAYQHDDRPNIAGVLFADGYAVATDGHRLVRVRVETGATKMFAGIEHVKAIVATQNAIDNENVTLAPKGPRIEAQLSEQIVLSFPAGNPSSYPPYEKLIESHNGMQQNASRPDGYILNPSYLAAIDEVHVACGGGARTGGVRVVSWAGDHLDSMMFKGAGDSLFLIMPMRA